MAEFECEIGLHGYVHGGAYQLSIQQERNALVKRWAGSL
jgi:hypothetical protein